MTNTNEVSSSYDVCITLKVAKANGLLLPTTPYVEEAGANDTLKVGEPITLVLPAFSDIDYTEVLFVFHTANFSAGIHSEFVPFIRGQETRTLAQVWPDKPFKAGDVATAQVHLRLPNVGWIASPVSVPYTFID